MKDLDNLLRELSKRFMPQTLCKIADTENKAKAWGVRLGDTRNFLVYPKKVIW